MHLFHASESPGITEFLPRAVEGETPLVWAIDRDHLPNYLFPRDCPRISHPARDGHRIIHVEEWWRERIGQASIWMYQLPPESFRLVDSSAGYFVSSHAVKPLSCQLVSDLVGALSEASAELVAVRSLWPIYDEITSTQSEFSCIRMRNAQPR